ncbi:MAG: hypothetical protein STSR0009_16450 [Methanoregula sp.]
MVWIRRMKRGNSVVLCKYRSVRRDGKVVSEFVEYLGVEGEQEKVPLPKKTVMKWTPPEQSVRSGDVTVLWHIAQELRIDRTINRVCGYPPRNNATSPGTLLTLWAINCAVDPVGAARLPAWIEGTDLPALVGFGQNIPGKEAFYAALDTISRYDEPSHKLIDTTTAIDTRLYSHWRKKHQVPTRDDEVLAYDLPSVIAYGDTRTFVRNRQRANTATQQPVTLSVIVSKHDQYPLTIRIQPGNHSSGANPQVLIPRVSGFPMTAGTLIYDRGSSSEESLCAPDGHGWTFIQGVPELSKEEEQILRHADIPETPENRVFDERTRDLYAVKLPAREASGGWDTIVYRDVTEIRECHVTRDRAIHEIFSELHQLRSHIDVNTQQVLRGAIDEILEGWESFFIITLPAEGNAVGFDWTLNTERMDEARAMEGKHLIYSTDRSLNAQEVVRLYLERESPDNFFRVMTVDEDQKPVRHPWGSRGRAYLFVCTLAYRLRSALSWRIRSADSENVSLGMEEFLLRLGEIDHLEMDTGKAVESFYVNVTADVRMQLDALGMTSILLPEKIPKKS